MSVLEVKKSPRFENGAWKWYYDNTFSLAFSLSVDGYSETIDNTNHSFYINFYKENGEQVYTFTPTAQTINVRRTGNNSPQTFLLTVNFDKRITHYFNVGNYSYCIKMVYTNPTSSEKKYYTLLAGGKAEVELCH